MYADFMVPSEPSLFDNKGENSFATVPSMIVEVGFHTNPKDALALKDPQFQKLSMKGVAKGMRLFREGASCAPFAVKQIEPMTANIGENAWVPVPLLGNPTYAVQIRTTHLNCDQWKCRSAQRMVYDRKEADAYRFRFPCVSGDEAAPNEFLVEAKDSHGVEAAFATFRIYCKKAA
jgi:hypothetical protein